MRFKVTALDEVTPVCIGTYIVEECDEEHEDILNAIVDDFIEHEITIKVQFDFPVEELEVEVDDESDFPTEENKEGWSLNSCSNPDEIFTNIDDFSGLPGKIIDISSGDGTTLPDQFINKIKQLDDEDELSDWEFEQEDYEVDLAGRLKVVKL
ncbi:MAG: hypothetical protein ACJZ47_05600 [bacterium]